MYSYGDNGLLDTRVLENEAGAVSIQSDQKFCQKMKSVSKSAPFCAWQGNMSNYLDILAMLSARELRKSYLRTT